MTDSLGINPVSNSVSAFARVEQAATDGESPYVVIQLRRGKRALVSACDAERVAAHTWGVSTVTRADGTQHGYANAYVNGKFTGMHRFILGLSASDKIHVDHINGDSLDNRRENLRLASRSHNLRNRRPDLRAVAMTDGGPVAVLECYYKPKPPKPKEPVRPVGRPKEPRQVIAHDPRRASVIAPDSIGTWRLRLSLALDDARWYRDHGNRKAASQLIPGARYANWEIVRIKRYLRERALGICTMPRGVCVVESP